MRPYSSSSGNTGAGEAVRTRPSARRRSRPRPADSEQSFDDAAQQAVRETAKTVRGIKSIWIDNFSGVVQGDRIVEFRVNAKISFVVEGHP